VASRSTLDNEADMLDPLVRLLGDGDRQALFRLAESDRAQSVFLIGNMLAYGFAHSDLHFWGLGQRTDPSDLAGVLMCVGSGANLFVLPGEDPAPLIELLLSRRPHFVMGSAATMEAVLARASGCIQQVEDHRLATLAAKDFPRYLVNAPAGVRVRRARERDVTPLAHLYFGTTGFEGMSFLQVQVAVDHRVAVLRAFVAESAHGIAAVAATSAETHADAMIGGVYTAPWARGQGMATAAVATLCDALIRQHRRPHLFYRMDNAPAEHVYAKIGFHIAGDWKVIYFDGFA
jgi:predicted GNAT family acetyltransferase